VFSDSVYFCADLDVMSMLASRARPFTFKKVGLRIRDEKRRLY